MNMTYQIRVILNSSLPPFMSIVQLVELVWKNLIMDNIPYDFTLYKNVSLLMILFNHPYEIVR